MSKLLAEHGENELVHRFRVETLDRLLQGTFVIALLGVPASLSRISLTGWLPLYAAHLILGAAAISLYLLRHKIGETKKFFTVAALFTGVGISGLIQLGLLGVGMWWLVVTSLLVSALYSVRAGIMAGMVTMLIVLAVAWCFVNGVLQVEVDANVYLASWSSWITLIVATSVMPFFVFQSVASLQDATADLLEQVRVQRDEIKHMASHDLLTGLVTPRVLAERMEVLLPAAIRSGERVALMFLDLDNFKAVNDTYGHDAGDYLLQQLAQRYQAIVRGEDSVVRVGGDEFILLFGQAGTDQQMARIAERLIEATRTPVEYQGHLIAVGASLGISVFPDHCADGFTLRKLADQAMYEVKRSGKNGFRFADSATLPKSR